MPPANEESKGLSSHQCTSEHGGFRADLRFDRNVGHADPNVRFRAPLISSEDETANVEWLAATLETGDAEAILAAIHSLGQRPSARASIPLCRAGRHPSITVSRAAMRLLSRIGPASLPAMCELIRSDAAIGREELYGETLAAIGPSAVPWLADRLAWRRGRLGTSTWQVVFRFVELCPCQELRQLLPMLDGQQSRLGRLHPNRAWLGRIQHTVEQLTSFHPGMPLAAAAPPTAQSSFPVPSHSSGPECAFLPVPLQAQTTVEKRPVARSRWVLACWKGVAAVFQKKKDL